VKSLRLRLYVSFRLLRHRLVEAALTRPTGQDWILAGQLLGLFALVTLPLAVVSGLVKLSPANVPWPTGFMVAARVLIFPAIVEEGFWRVLLLPHKTERMGDRKRWLLGLPILGLFVLMHPLNGMTLYPEAFSTFTNPVFLLSTTLLGLICMIAYWQSGSWWVPTAIHWLVVVLWLLVFGGYEKLHS
jgi:predicted Abi (CAAX) family protease